MRKAFPFSLGLLVILSLGASSVLAGGGDGEPDAQETAERAADGAGRTAEERGPDAQETLPDVPVPAIPGPPQEISPSVPRLPGNNDPEPPTTPEEPETPADEPATPTPPQQVPPAPEKPTEDVPVPNALPQHAGEATNRIGALLVPIESTADALGAAAVRLITGGIDTGTRVVAWMGGAADDVGADAAETVNGVIALLMSTSGQERSTHDGAAQFLLGTNAAAANVVEGANRAAVVTLFAIGSMGAAFAGFAVGRRLLSLGGMALLSRIPSKDIMKNGTRAAVFEIVQSDPGVSLNEIVERLGISRNAVAYHLAVFEQESSMVSIKDGKYRRYFVNGGKFANGAKVVVSAIRNDITRTVAAFIAQNPGVIQKEVCAAIGTSPSATNWHIGRLEKVGLVEKQKVANTVKYQPGPSFAKYDLSDFGLQSSSMGALA